MTNIATLNFTQMVAPQAATLPIAGNVVAGAAASPIPAGAAVSTGVANSAAQATNNNAATDIFNLLISQGKELPIQANFADMGKNLPVADANAAATKLKTSDNGIDALQNVLAGLLVQQAAQQQTFAQPAVVSGDQSNAVLLGGLASAAQDTGDNAANVLAVLGSQVKADGAAAAAANVATNNAAADTALSGKTLAAYRATAALSDSVPGSTLDATDSNALIQAANLKAGADIASGTTKNNLSGSDSSAISLLEAKDKSPQTLTESISRLNSLSAMTPLPPVSGQQKQVGLEAEGNKPLDQIANLQNALAQAKPEVKADAAADVKTNAQDGAQANTAAQSNPLATAVQSQQQFGQQQSGNKELAASKTPAAVESVDDDVAVNNNINTQPQQGVVKSDMASAQNFAAHLGRVMSPADQIAVKLGQLPAGKQNISVQLDPIELGKVDIKLEWGADGRANMTISAERKETLDMLKGDMGSLQRSLADSGIKTDAGSMQFSLKGESQQQLASQMGGGNGQGNKSQQGSNNAYEQSGANDNNVAAARYVNINNLLDLSV